MCLDREVIGQMILESPDADKSPRIGEFMWIENGLATAAPARGGRQPGVSAQPAGFAAARDRRGLIPNSASFSFCAPYFPFRLARTRLSSAAI